MTNTARPRLVALCLALACLLVAGCGGGDDDVDKILKDTFSGSKPVKSGRLDVKLRVELEGSTQVKGPIDLQLVGPFQSRGTKQLPRFDFDLKLAASGQTLTAGAISTGSEGFLKVQGTSFVVDPRIFQQFKRGFEVAQARQNKDDKKAPTFATLGVDPRNWLKDPKTDGTQDVGGVETTKITAGIDVPKLLTDVDKLLKRAGSLGAQNQNLPNALTAAQRSQLERAVKNATFEVYSGKDDRILRRLVVKLDFDASQAQGQKAPVAQGGKITFDLTLADLGKELPIKAPANPRPFSELSGAISQLGGLGALGGATGGGGGGGQTTTPATPPATTGGSGGAGNDYLQCLQSAGGDIAKAQQCADLLK